MKRRLLAIAVFILLGALVNVAVAWGCAHWSGEPSTPTVAVSPAPNADTIPLGERAQLTALSWRETPSNDRYVYYLHSVTFTSFGVDRCVWIERMYQGAESDNPGQPGYGRVAAQRHDAGFPLRSMSGIAINRNPMVQVSGLGESWQTHNAILLPVSTTFIAGIMRRLLPTQPLWPGFAVDTLFYALVLWLLFVSPFKLRCYWRIRRNLCPACAYPVGTSTVCTECGKPVRGRRTMEVLI